MDMLDDRNVEVPEKPYAVLVVREVRNDDAERQLKIAKRVFGVLQQDVGNVVLLPFCGADERFAKKLAELCKVHSLASGLWKNPGGLQWVVANAAYVLSLGRLHPLVFAVGSRRPCCAVTYPWLTGYDKINAFMNHCGLGHRVMDWGLGVGEIGARVQDAVRSRAADKQIVEAYSGHLKGLALEALCPVWGAMGVEHGLGLERGMKWSDFRPDEYDDTYYFGARIFKKGEEFAVYHPSRGDWAEWDVIRDLVIKHTNPKSLIDVGCARGWFLKRMIDAGVTAHGVDMSTAAWAEPAQGMQEHIKVGMVADVAHRRYDVVTVFDVMEHIYLDDLSDAISAIKNAAGKYIVLNICAARDGEPAFTIKKGEPISPELEWLAVSGHVTIRHRAWWRKRFEDDDWESDEAMVDAWLADERLRYPSWERHNLLILRRRAAV